MNDNTKYFQTGLQAGKAAKRKDYRLVNHFAAWLSKAIAGESEAEKLCAREQYAAGYRIESGFGR